MQRVLQRTRSMSAAAAAAVAPKAGPLATSIQQKLQARFKILQAIDGTHESHGLHHVRAAASLQHYPSPSVQEALEPLRLSIQNDSHKHAGHAGNPSGAPDAETHFK
jgi:hypothetical protein